MMSLKNMQISTENRKLNAYIENLGKHPVFGKVYGVCCSSAEIALSINTYGYDVRMLIWKESSPSSFAINRVHYARYGMYYVSCLD